MLSAFDLRTSRSRSQGHCVRDLFKQPIGKRGYRSCRDERTERVQVGTRSSWPLYPPSFVCRIAPPVLPIDLGPRNEQNSILRQGTFIQFSASHRMNSVFVALLLRDVRREKRHSAGVKKKIELPDSDLDAQKRSKREVSSFQFETEARASLRRQQPGKARRKSTATSPHQRSKSNGTRKRDLASTSLTQFDMRPVQQPRALPVEPKVLTLSERLASIGRITSSLDSA